jgi:hypothetical protein
MTNAGHLAHHLGQTCRCKEEHVPGWGGDTAQQAARYTPQLANAVVRGFIEQLQEDDPARLQELQRTLHRKIVSEGLAAEKAMIMLHSRLAARTPSRGYKAYVILDEGTSVPNDGIEFVPREQSANMPKALLAVVRRMYLNTGHPTNRDLERMCRLAGASPQGILIKGLKCSACERCATPAIPRPSGLKDHLGGFNTTVQMDVVYVKDAGGTTHD